MAFVPLYAWYVSLGRISNKSCRVSSQSNPSGRFDTTRVIKVKGETDFAFVHTLPLYGIDDLHGI